ncbi:MAG: hypothetical protein J7D61_07885 [Marichromatium sp.]|nr:hypothetical protein [Marichromatium sp.]
MNENNNPALKMVAEFQEVFQTPRSVDLWRGLVAEEAREAREAIVHLFKELADLNYVMAGLYLEAQRGGVDVENDDAFQAGAALCDAIDRLFEDPASPLQRAFERVHASNMTKVGDNGEPLRDPETGKILKGPNYQPAEPAIHQDIFGEAA